MRTRRPTRPPYLHTSMGETVALETGEAFEVEEKEAEEKEGGLEGPDSNLGGCESSNARVR